MLSHIMQIRIILLGLALALASALPTPAAPQEAAVELAPQEVAPGAVTLELTLSLPPDWQLTPEAPQSVRLSVRNPEVLQLTPAAEAALRQPRFPVSLPLTAAAGHTVLTLDLVLNLCRADGKGMCLIREARLVVPVTVAEGAKDRVLKVPYALRAP
ncbi:MAG: hypothetical protein WHT07_11135 [Desulfobaccales bacterium]